MPAWESARRQRAWALSDPRSSSPARMRKKCCYGQKNFGPIYSSLFPSPTHLSHTRNINPFENKVWEVYFFYKEVCSFVIWSRRYSWLCFCIVDKFTYLGSSVSSTEKDIDTRLTKAWTAIDRLSIIWKSDLTDKMKRSFFQAAVVSILLYGCTTWTLTKRLERKIDGNYTRMLRAVLNKSWRQHPTRHQLYGHLPPPPHHENYTS